MNGITNLGKIREVGDILVGISGTKSIDIVVAAGQDLKRGCLLGRKTADKKYYPWNPNLTTEQKDGTEMLLGVLGADSEATLEDDNSFMIVVGEFDVSKLTAAEDVVIEAGSYNYGNLIFRELV